MAPTARRLNADDVYARLTPWLAALKLMHPPGHDEVPAFHRDDVMPRVVWIGARNIGRPDSEPLPLDHICEALSLLGLLARVDIKAWKVVVLKVWPSDASARRWIERSVPETFTVGLDLFEMSPHWFESPRQLNDYDVSASADYVRVREYLEAEHQGEDAQDKSHVTVKMRIELDLMGETSEGAAEWLEHTLDIIKVDEEKKSTRDSANAEKQPRLNVTDVAFSSTVAFRIDNDGLKHLHELVKRGIRLSHLPPLELEVSSDEPLEFVRQLRDIACLDGDLDKPGVRTISINDYYSADFVPDLLAAAQHSTLVSTVEIDFGNGEEYMFEDQSDFWKMAAYALFSRHADHKIHTLELNVENLQDIEVEAVREVLEAPDPVEMVIDRSIVRVIDVSPLNSSIRQLVASRFMVDTHTDAPHQLLETKSPLAVRVLEAPTPGHFPYWTVRFPGHEDACVHVDDVLSTSEDELKLLNRESNTVPAFPRIDITRMSDYSMDAVEDLIELVGTGTERLDLHEHTGDVPVDDWCNRVLAVCPKLKELQLRQACLENLEVFVAAAQEGYCHLRELLALVVPTGENADHIQTFFKALSEPTHPLTMNLEDLDLRLLIDTQDPDDVIEPVLRMLEKNRRLLVFHLNIQLPEPLQSLLPEYKAALNERFGEVVTIRTGPLDIRKKAAFLSVVNEKSSDGDSAVGRLDSSVLSIVLQFAANGRKRDFEVTYGLFADE